MNPWTKAHFSSRTTFVSFLFCFVCLFCFFVIFVFWLSLQRGVLVKGWRAYLIGPFWWVDDLVAHAFYRHLLVRKTIRNACALGKLLLQVLCTSRWQQAAIRSSVRCLAHVALLFWESSLRAKGRVMCSPAWLVIIFAYVPFLFWPRIFRVLKTGRNCQVAVFRDFQVSCKKQHPN